MSLENRTLLRVVLYEGSGAKALSATERFEVVTALLGKGYSLSCLGKEEPGLEERGNGGPMLVLGRFGGEAPSLGSWGKGARIEELPEKGAGEVQELAAKAVGEMAGEEPGVWKPWFPVIDYDRCTNCMQCLSFCLFGVYGVDQEQQIEVQHGEQCKTNCPACSRVCPEAAIIFPKYKAGPINGDAVQASDLEREKMKIDISSLLGGDIYQMLRQRSERAQSRFSKERDADKALTERQKCLVKLAQEGDIPPEVLMSLPSPEEIQRRAEEAKARTQAARAKRQENPD